MTKHNAEMENSREQSRVCARLPLNLQLFAEDTGENGADTNAATALSCRSAVCPAPTFPPAAIATTASTSLSRSVRSSR